LLYIILFYLIDVIINFKHDINLLLNSILYEFKFVLFSFQYYLNKNEEEDLDLIEETLLFKGFTFKRNKFLNFEPNLNERVEITLLRNLQNEIHNQILQYPKYIYLIFYYIEGNLLHINNTLYLSLYIYFLFIYLLLFFLNIIQKKKKKRGW